MDLIQKWIEWTSSSQSLPFSQWQENNAILNFFYSIKIHKGHYLFSHKWSFEEGFFFLGESYFLHVIVKDNIYAVFIERRIRKWSDISLKDILKFPSHIHCTFFYIFMCFNYGNLVKSVNVDIFPDLNTLVYLLKKKIVSRFIDEYLYIKCFLSGVSFL